MKRHYSQSDPYTSALYLKELLTAIDWIAENLQPDDTTANRPTLSALTTIATERAEDLVTDLSNPRSAVRAVG